MLHFYVSMDEDVFSVFGIGNISGLFFDVVERIASLEHLKGKYFLAPTTDC